MERICIKFCNFKTFLTVIFLQKRCKMTHFATPWHRAVWNFILTSETSVLRALSSQFKPTLNKKIELAVCCHRRFFLFLQCQSHSFCYNGPGSSITNKYTFAKYLPKLANNYNEGYEMGIINLIVPREEKAPESPLHVASLGYSIKSSPIGVVSF